MLRDGIYKSGGDYCLVENGVVVKRFNNLSDIKLYVRDGKVISARKYNLKKRSKRKMSLLEKRKYLENLKKAWKKSHSYSAERKRMLSNRKRKFLSDSLLDFLRDNFSDIGLSFSLVDMGDGYLFYVNDKSYYLYNLEEVFDFLCEIL